VIFLFLIILLISNLLLIGCSTTKPKQGENGWDGIKLYKPIPEQQKFIAADKTEIKYMAITNQYLLISVNDYLEICALIESAVLWNKKMFFNYLKEKPPP